MKKFLALLLSAIMVLAAVSALAEAELKLTVYSPGNVESVPTKTIIEYARLVNEASDGKIELTVHHSGELGNAGLVYLAEGDNGMRHISTTNRPVHTAADVEGLKLRVPTSQMYLDCWEALGANPVALALNELAIALSNGTAEGQDNATYHLVANATYDDIKYFSYINYMWMGCTMAANAATWNKIAPEYQEILKEQAKVAAKYSFDTIAQDNVTAQATLEAAGVQFDEEPDIQSFKDKLGIPAYYENYKDQPWYNQEIIDAILAQ